MEKGDDGKGGVELGGGHFRAARYRRGEKTAEEGEGKRERRRGTARLDRKGDGKTRRQK